MRRARRAAFFDMDRTLLRVNSAQLWMQQQARAGRASRADVLRMGLWLAQYTLGVLDVDTLARGAARTMQGRSASAFQREARSWVEAQVLAHASEAARAEVARRHREGYLCAVLTSSTRYAAERVAEHFGIEHVLASALVEDAQGNFTGEPVRPLPYGPGKVLVARAWALAHDVDLEASAFFTDSVSDLPLLEAVAEPVAVNPDPRLWWAATRRGWRVVYW